MKTLFNGRARGVRIVLWAVSAVLIGVLTSCVPPAGAEGENFTLFLSGGGPAKAISSQTVADLSYELELSGPGGTIRSSAGPGTTSVTLTLVPGSWTVTVNAFRNGRPFGRGVITVTVGGGSTGAVVPMSLFPVWYVAGDGAPAVGNDDNPGSEERPLATVAKALAEIVAAYNNGDDWSNNGLGSGNPVPARIVISGTITNFTENPLSTSLGLVEIDDTGMYNRRPPIILEGGAGGGTLDATSLLKRVLYINNADVTLGPGLALTGGSVTDRGGGVLVETGGKFTMTGGAISGNHATGRGGGVYVDGGTFTMPTGSTAAIKGNTATVEGGGVYVNYGTFTMSDGTIGGSDSADANTAVRGGGVYTMDVATFAMSGNAAVKGNTAIGTNASGGGVYLDSPFGMTGGTISGNSATGTNSSGGGVYVAMHGNFIMSGGTIGGGNEATDGGGVYLKDTGSSFIMSGSAAVSNNIATGNGGGVYVYSGTFTKSGGGTIYGNPPDTDANTASGDGHAVYVHDASTPKKRNSTADSTVNLDSTYSGSIPGGNWE